MRFTPASEQEQGVWSAVLADSPGFDGVGRRGDASHAPRSTSAAPSLKASWHSPAGGGTRCVSASLPLLLDRDNRRDHLRIPRDPQYRCSVSRSGHRLGRAVALSSSPGHLLAAPGRDRGVLCRLYPDRSALLQRVFGPSATRRFHWSRCGVVLQHPPSGYLRARAIGVALRCHRWRRRRSWRGRCATLVEKQTTAQCSE